MFVWTVPRLGEVNGDMVTDEPASQPRRICLSTLRQQIAWQ